MELDEITKKLKELNSASNGDLKHEIKALEEKLKQQQEEIFNNLTTWHRVLLARHPNRPYSLDYINSIFSDFIELKGDRAFGNDNAIVAGFAKLNKKKVIVIGNQKGKDIKERNLRNFGMAHPEGYRKALRIMKLASKFKLPIITFIDTPGAYPGIASEERHIGESIAALLKYSFSIEVPIISVIIGEGGSGGALGIGIANTVLMLQNSYYSVISPEGCASILWKDDKKTEHAATQMKINAEQLKQLAVIEEIIEEPFGGAHKNYELTMRNVKKYLEKHLTKLLKLSNKALLEHRYNRFRKFNCN